MSEDESDERRRRPRRPRVEHPHVYDIEIIRPRCTAVATCMEIASKTFDLDDEAVAFVSKVNGNSPDDILEAAKSCPVDAIFLTHRETGERVWPPRDKRFEKGVGDVTGQDDEGA